MVVPQEKISDYSPSIDQILEREQKRKRGIGYILKQGFGLILILALFIASWYTAEVSPQIFWEGLPRLGSWVERMFPPDFSEFPT
ncbi:MAG: phosphonate ABC transporter, permease protein PhnE, partial [Spirulinaceae cyanobacterium]